MSYHPGEANLRMAHALVVNKIDSATPEQIERVQSSINIANPHAMRIDAASPIQVDDPSVIRGRRVLVIEDGPTCTHGEMGYGAGVVPPENSGSEVDPRPWAVSTMLIPSAVS
jgi:predicted GTPase